MSQRVGGGLAPRRRDRLRWRPQRRGLLLGLVVLHVGGVLAILAGVSAPPGASPRCLAIDFNEF